VNAHPVLFRLPSAAVPITLVALAAARPPLPRVRLFHWIGQASRMIADAEDLLYPGTMPD
jgi:hypothetical protein